MALWGCAEQRSLCWTVVPMVSPIVGGGAAGVSILLESLSVIQPRSTNSGRVSDSMNALQERFRLVTEHHEISMENKQTETSRETSSKKHPRVLPALNLSVKEAGVNPTLLLCLF